MRAGCETASPRSTGRCWKPVRSRLTVNRGPVVPRSWELAERHDVAVRAGGRIVRGWWGLLPDPPRPGAPEGGVRLYHLGRLVGTPEWFGHPTPAAHPALNRLVGEVELPHVPVTMNKADVDRGSAAWVAVEARLHVLLATPVRRLTREPASSVTPEALRTADQVRRILAKALRLLEEGGSSNRRCRWVRTAPGASSRSRGCVDLRRSRTTRASPAQLATGQPVRMPRRRANGLPDFPATEPPGAPGLHVAAERPRWSFGAWIPGCAARWSRKTASGGSSSTARYPLYEVRRGDLWYQLETALREVCVTIPEATVPEFERKVNELMLVSLALADRAAGREDTDRAGGTGSARRGCGADGLACARLGHTPMHTASHTEVLPCRSSARTSRSPPRPSRSSTRSPARAAAAPGSPRCCSSRRSATG